MKGSTFSYRPYTWQTKIDQRVVSQVTELANNSKWLEYMGRMRRGGRESGWEEHQHAVTSSHATLWNDTLWLNLTYMQPTDKKVWSHFFPLLSPLFIPITSFVPTFMQIFAETDYRSDLTANHSIELILGSFPHLCWHKDGDGSIHLGQDCPIW